MAQKEGNEAEAQRAAVACCTALINNLLEKHKDFEPQYYTAFDAQKPPGISIEKYFERIVKYAPCSFGCYMVAFFYLQRIAKQYRDFIFTEFNIHRFVITSVMVATKFHEDFYYSNSFYAKVGGVPVQEINNLEIEFLLMLNFDLHFETKNYDQCQKEALTLLDSTTKDLFVQHLVFKENTPNPLKPKGHSKT